MHGGACPCVLAVVLLSMSSAFATEISSQLDFGSEDDSSSKKITINSENLKLEKLQAATSDEPKYVCTESGCNSTEIKTKTDGVITDVLVHVKTSVDTSKTPNETDVPDIPIIVGNAGVTQSNFPSDSLVNSNPLLISNADGNYAAPNRRIGTENLFVPSTSGYLYPQTAVNVNTHTPVVIPRKYADPTYKQVSYDTNYLYVPYFEPSLHSHNFAERPPPQSVWYPKSDVSFNPLEFRRFHHRPTLNGNQWNSVQWNRKPQVGYGQRTTPGYTTCTCQNPALNWYPTTPSWQVQNSGVKIDDKLAPLN